MISTQYGNIILLEQEKFNFFRKNYGFDVFDNWILNIKKKYSNISIGRIDLNSSQKLNKFNIGLSTYQNIEQLKEILPGLFKNQQYVSFIELEQQELKEKRKLFEKPYNCFNLISKDAVEAIEQLNILVIKNYELVLKTEIKNKKLFVIGDIHEDVEALKSLISDVDNNEYTYCFNGDYLDKGNQTKEIIDYVYDIYKKGNAIIVLGNHESFVYKRLLKQVQSIPNEEEIFSSIKFLEKDENFETRKKFFELYENSVPFIKFEFDKHKGFITHAPCERKYLGKFDNESLRNQRNLYFKERGEGAMQRELAFMLEGEQLNDTIHVFGHVAHNMEIVQANNYWLDTGSVHGNKLSGVFIEKELKIKQVQGNLLYNNNKLFNFTNSNKPKL